MVDPVSNKASGGTWAHFDLDAHVSHNLWGLGDARTQFSRTHPALAPSPPSCRKLTAAFVPAALWSTTLRRRLADPARKSRLSERSSKESCHVSSLNERKVNPRLQLLRLLREGGPPNRRRSVALTTTTSQQWRRQSGRDLCSMMGLRLIPVSCCAYTLINGDLPQVISQEATHREH